MKIENTNLNARNNGQIMGINVISTSLPKVLTRVIKKISDNTKIGKNGNKFYIVTPNPELILMAQKDKKLKIALNSADLAIPDGIGLKISMPDLEIIKGRELFSQLIKLAEEREWRVFLLGGLGKEAELTAKKLKEKYRQLKIRADHGWKLDQRAKPVTEIDLKLQKKVIGKINRFAPDILFVAFGNPKQEIWINENISRLNIKGAMAVGGTFRYVAGLSALPPKWVEKLGFEWFWRLITEPKRAGRVWNAVVVFPLKVLLKEQSGGFNDYS
jgi:N-acetylglucosaminyldiphosphoundecaprenol N-acetyl-beta-D-mannosaminyltransferase